MEKIQLNIIGLSYSQTQTGAYALVLSEADGKRRLPIIIGGNEAQSIAIALEKDVVPPRPLAHDLFKSMADSFGIEVSEVIIHRLEDGVFFASLVCFSNTVDELEIDARTSDAIALAIRFGAPIYTYEHILEKAGIVLEEQEEESAATSSEKELAPAPAEENKPSQESDLEKLNTEALKERLGQAVEQEDYELAAQIHAELKRRGAEE